MLALRRSRSWINVQQAVITALRGYLNSPGVQRSDVREVMKLLNQPMIHSNVRKLRQGYEELQKNRDVGKLLTALKELEGTSSTVDSGQSSIAGLTKEDLHLVCFDFVCS